MIDPLAAAMTAAASGLQAQSMRLRIVSENIANAESTGATPGADPYARRTLAFHSALDRAAGVSLVKAGEAREDDSPFRLDRDPGNPAARRQRHGEATERRRADRDGRYARGQPRLSGQSASYQAIARNGGCDHRFVEERSMIELTRAAGVSAFTMTPAGAATAPAAETAGRSPTFSGASRATARRRSRRANPRRCRR
jgi:hypothetical protein